MLIGAKPTLMVALATLIGSVVAARAETSSGSGVVIGSKGEILTNAHVVQECRTITVKLASGKSEPAELVARDERNDLAVVRLTGTNNPPTPVVSSEKAPPFALAIRLSLWVSALRYPRYIAHARLLGTCPRLRTQPLCCLNRPSRAVVRVSARCCPEVPVGFDLDQPTAQLRAITLVTAMAMEPPCHG